jgi:hypothetical protein
MDNFTSIQLKHTDPDTGLITFKTIAEISHLTPHFVSMIAENFDAESKDGIHPNTELVIIENGTHPDAEDKMIKVFQLGELAYTCLSTKQSKFGNDQTLGNAIRSKYIELND